MFEHVKVVDHFSRVINWNKESDEMESMFISREVWKNIISYVVFSIVFHVNKCFPDLKQTFRK